MPAHGQRPYSPFELTWLNREPGRPAFLISTLPSSDLHFRTYSSDTSSLILFFWFIFVSLFSSTPERLSRDHRFVRFLFVRGMDDLLASNARSRNEGKKERCTKREQRSLRSKGKRRDSKDEEWRSRSRRISRRGTNGPIYLFSPTRFARTSPIVIVASYLKRRNPNDSTTRR